LGNTPAGHDPIGSPILLNSTEKVVMNKSNSKCFLLAFWVLAFFLASTVFALAEIPDAAEPPYGAISTTPFPDELNLWELSFRGSVEVHVYAPDGRHTGHVSKYSADREIKEIQYERYQNYPGFHTTVFVSLKPDYRIELKSIGSEFFSLKVRKIQKTKITQTTFYNRIRVTEKTTGSMTLTPEAGPGDLYINHNEPGGSQLLVRPDHFFAGNERDDEIPPVTTIRIDPPPVPGRPFSYTVTFEVEDNEGGCGVYGTFYSFDKEAWIQFAEPFVFTPGCPTTLTYFSTDYNFSQEEPRSVIINGCPAR
jgi:hypothetical protein